MNVFTVIGIVGISMVVMTAFMAFVFYRLDSAVVQNNSDIAAQKDRYNLEGMAQCCASLS